jgi:hypothetical protein
MCSKKCKFKEETPYKVSSFFCLNHRAFKPLVRPHENVPSPSLGKWAARPRKGSVAIPEHQNRALSVGTVNGTNGTQKLCFGDVPFTSDRDENVTNVTFFSGFWECNIREFRCPVSVKQALFFNRMGQCYGIYFDCNISTKAEWNRFLIFIVGKSTLRIFK